MIEDPHLDDDARKALATGEAVVREFIGANGALCCRVVEPYTSGVGGVIVTYQPAATSVSSVEKQTRDIFESLTMATTRIGTWTLEADGSRVDWDQRFGEITGLNGPGQSLEDSGFVDAIEPEDRPGFEQSLQALIQNGEALDQELRFRAPKGVMRWVRLRAQRAQKDGSDLIVGIISDITERKSESERSDFMMRELDHRVKNLLAIILSIAEISARSNDDIETYKNDFRARLESMARTHNLLAQAQWTGSDLRSLVEEEVYNLAPRSAVDINGASVEISPSATQSLAMFFHELTVNALKHGALAADDGRIEINWEIDKAAGERLLLQWSESCGGDVSAPSREGFGGKVINRIVKRQLDAEVNTNWDAAGIQLTASIPLKGIAASSSIDRVNS
jgi:two-component system, chemotaxis family, CheB/CheR fusion protein